MLGNIGGKKTKDRLKDSLQTEIDVCKAPLLLTDLLPHIILLGFLTVLARQQWVKRTMQKRCSLFYIRVCFRQIISHLPVFKSDFAVQNIITIIMS